MYWALPFAVGVAALNAPFGLVSCILLAEFDIDFGEFFYPGEGWFFRWISALYVQELENVRHFKLGKLGFDELADFAHIGATLEPRFEKSHDLAHILDRLCTRAVDCLIHDFGYFCVRECFG